MSVQYATGFTGVAVVVLAALAYAFRISIDVTASHPALTASFLILNLVAWGLGAPIYVRDRRSVLGVTLMVLGDAIFPLNIYAPIFLYLPVFRGSVAASASLILALGIVYHLANYLRVEKSRFHASFYPYFFAITGVVLIQLARFTLGAPMLVAHGLSLTYAAAYLALARSRSLEPRRDFGLGSAVCVFVTGLVAAADVALGKSPAALGVLFVVALLLAVHAATQVSLGAFRRAVGGAAYLTLTLASTGALHLSDASLTFYVVGTSIWVALLAAVGILLKGASADPFKESAHWLSVGLGLGLAAATWPAWRSLVGLGSPSPFEIFGSLPPIALATALLLVGLSLLVLSHWRQANPSIALSVIGFVAGMAFLNVATFTGPLMTLLATSGMASTITTAVPGQVVIPLVMGAFGLLLARRGEAAYPMAAIDLAGVCGVLLSAYNARGNPLLAAGVLLAGALVLLWRSSTGSALWSYLGFLLLITSSFIHFGLGVDSLPVALVAAALLVLASRLAGDPARPFEVAMGLISAVILAIAAIALETFGKGELPTFALAWLGLLAGVRVLSPPTDGTNPLEETVGALRFLGYCIGHVAGALLVVFLVRRLDLAPGLEAVALAAWAWLHLLILRRLGPMRDAALTLATGFAVHGVAVTSLVLALGLGGPAVWVACALVYAVLCFLIATEGPTPVTGLGVAGHAITFLAIAVGVAGGIETTLIALGGSASIFFWRSLRERSFLPHVIFLMLGFAGAALAAFAYRASVGALPLAILALGIALTARGQSEEEGMSARVRLGLTWGVMAAGAALALELVTGPPVLATLLVLWLGFPGVVFWWMRGSGVGSAPERPGGASADEWVLRGVIWVSQAAGTALVWHGLPLDPRHRVVALAVWVALNAAILGALGLLTTGRSVSVAARQAIHGLSILTLILAGWRFRDGLWSVAACAIIAAVYLVRFYSEKRRAMEHLAAVAACEGLVILGASNGVAFVDYYLLCVGLYRCLLVAHQPQAKTVRPGSSGDFLTALSRLFTVENALPALAVLVMVGYPAAAMIGTMDETHLAFLAAGSVILLHVLVAARAHALFVYAVCLSFLFGVTWGVIMGGAQPVLWLVMVLAGVLIIAGLMRAHEWDQRLPSGGSR